MVFSLQINDRDSESGFFFLSAAAIHSDRSTKAHFLLSRYFIINNPV